jgi:hypothetical protein
MSANRKNFRTEHTESNTSFTERNTRTNETARKDGSQKQIAQDQGALPAGQWLRVVLGFDAPFGHDGLPTVWG